MLKVIVIVPETSLLVVSGCGLGRGSKFFFVMNWVGLGQSLDGLDLAWSKKMDPRTTPAATY